MLEISAELVLVNLFSGGKKCASTKDLAEIRRKIKAATGSVYVDIAASDVRITVRRLPDLFKWGKGKCSDFIYPVNRKQFTPEYVENYYNWRLPRDKQDILIPILRGEK